jgi:hypothetical protein
VCGGALTERQDGDADDCGEGGGRAGRAGVVGPRARRVQGRRGRMGLVVPILMESRKLIVLGARAFVVV